MARRTRSTGYVRAKIRANTARRNGEGRSARRARQNASDFWKGNIEKVMSDHRKADWSSLLLGVNAPGDRDLSGLDMSHATFDGANLSRTRLGGSDLSGASLIHAFLGGSYAQRANFSEANLTGADLKGARLEFADFQNADLKGADLKGANLSRALLGGADLRGASLVGANLTGAELAGVHVMGADMRRTEGLTPSQKAVFWDQGAEFDLNMTTGEPV